MASEHDTVETQTAATQSATPKSSVATAAVLRWARLCVIGACVAIVFAEATGVRWPFNLITPFTPQVAVIALLGVLMLTGLVWRGRRTWRQERVYLTLGAVTALYASAITFGLIPWRVAPPARFVSATDANVAQIKVLSANVHTSNTNHRAIVDLIAAEQPDIVLLMELNTQWVNDLKVLDAAYPHRRALPDETGNFGIGLWTKLGVDDAQLVLMRDDGEPISRLDVPQVDATLDVKDAAGAKHRIRFIGLHPLPPMNPAMSGSRDAVIARAANSVAEKSTLPTIVAGDLNLTRYCRMIRRLTGPVKLSDAASPIRFSWPNRWSKWATGIRIDHTLISDHWRVVDVHAGSDIGSDHMPIVTTLQLVRTAD